MNIEKLILIYNGDMSLRGGLEYVGQLLTGKPSECALCDITHHTVQEKSEWKSCKVSFGIPVEALYRNQLTDELKQVCTELPCVIGQTESGYVMLLNREELEECRTDVATLEAKIREKMEGQ